MSPLIKEKIMLNLNQFQIVGNTAMVAVALYNEILKAISLGQNVIEVSFNTGEGGVFHDYILPLNEETGEPLFAGFAPAPHQREEINPLAQKLDREILFRAYDVANVGGWLRTRAREESVVVDKKDLIQVLESLYNALGYQSPLYTGCFSAPWAGSNPVEKETFERVWNALK
ncbi:hypothetical protein KBA63_01650 [Candidatus Woesebacteria bacterium]|nr:hypothetical protein [Candidatus Woesebacteria bacterium]